MRLYLLLYAGRNLCMMYHGRSLHVWKLLWNTTTDWMRCALFLNLPCSSVSLRVVLIPTALTGCAWTGKSSWRLCLFIQWRVDACKLPCKIQTGDSQSLLCWTENRRNEENIMYHVHWDGPRCVDFEGHSFYFRISVLYMVFFLWWLQIGLFFVHWQRFFYCFLSCVSVEEPQRDVWGFVFLLCMLMMCRNVEPSWWLMINAVFASFSACFH